MKKVIYRVKSTQNRFPTKFSHVRVRDETELAHAVAGAWPPLGLVDPGFHVLDKFSHQPDQSLPAFVPITTRARQIIPENRVQQTITISALLSVTIPLTWVTQIIGFRPPPPPSPSPARGTKPMSVSVARAGVRSVVDSPRLLLS